MPRRNQNRRRPQHHKGRQRPRGWHRNLDSPGLRKAARWLEGSERERPA